MKHFLLGLILAIGLTALASPAAAQTVSICDTCGIDEGNIDAWRAIDPSGDGRLTTFDIVLFRRFVQFAQFGFPIIFQEDLAYYWEAQTDCNGDGVWNFQDMNILNALADYFLISGNTQAHIDHISDCLRAVILGVCPD